MTDSRSRSFWQAILFAILYDGLTLLLGWLLLGPPPSLAKMPLHKATVTVGLPSVSQLLDPHHQVLSVHVAHGHMSSGALSLIVVSFLTLVVFTFANGCYVSLLGRSVRMQPERKTLTDGFLAFGPLFVWMLVQMLVSAILSVLTAFGSFGFAIMVVLLLLFRYLFLFFEYTVVIEQIELRQAFTKAFQWRKKVETKALLWFLVILVVNLVLADLLNLTFSVFSLAVFVLVNSAVLTLLQRWLVVHFLQAAEPSRTSV